MKNRKKQIDLVAEIVSLSYELVNARAEVRKRKAMLQPGEHYDKQFCQKHFDEITFLLGYWRKHEAFIIGKLDKVIPALAAAGYLDLSSMIRRPRRK